MREPVPAFRDPVQFPPPAPTSSRRGTGAGCPCVRPFSSEASPHEAEEPFRIGFSLYAAQSQLLHRNADASVFLVLKLERDAGWLLEDSKTRVEWGCFNGILYCPGASDRRLLHKTWNQLMAYGLRPGQRRAIFNWGRLS